MVLEQGWATPTLQEDEEENELPTATLDITSEIGSDIEPLPEAEVRYTYQDLALSTEQLHQWSNTDNYANTAGARAIQEPAKGKKRRQPEATKDYPTILSPTDVRAWASRMTFRRRRPLPGLWIHIPTETQ